MLYLVCPESKSITWLSVMAYMACGVKQFMRLLSLLVLAHSDVQRLPEGRSSHKSCSGCEGPVMAFPASFLSQEVCKSCSTPVIFSAVLSVFFNGSHTVLLSMLSVITVGAPPQIQPAVRSHVCMQTCRRLGSGHAPRGA